MLDYYLGKQFPEELNRYTEYFLERALPPLEDLDNKADAIERAGAAFLRLESFDNPQVATVSARAELTAEAYFNRTLSLRHALLGLFVLGLYHLFEQQLGRVYAYLTRFDPDPGPFSVESASTTIEAASGVRPADVTAWQDLMELRSVANVVKHGEGSAAEKLRKIRSDLFQHPAIKGSSPESWPRVRRPLAGEDLYLERTDFERYGGAARAFWKGLADAFAGRES